MYGTVATMRAKPGMADRLNQMSQQWWNERAPSVPGAMSSTVFQTDRDPNEFVLVVVFDSKDNYHANANNPAQNQWFQELRGLLEADPQWTDGEVVFRTP